MIDVKTDPEGDLVFSEGDLATVSGANLATQVLWNVLRTGGESWQEYPDISPQIFSVIGRPNTEEDALEIAQEVQQKLNELSLFQAAGAIRVTPTPLDTETLLLRIDTPVGAYGFTLDFHKADITWTTPTVQGSNTPSHRLPQRPSNPILRRNHS